MKKLLTSLLLALSLSASAQTDSLYKPDRPTGYELNNPGDLQTSLPVDRLFDHDQIAYIQAGYGKVSAMPDNFWIDLNNTVDGIQVSKILLYQGHGVRAADADAWNLYAWDNGKETLIAKFKGDAKDYYWMTFPASSHARRFHIVTTNSYWPTEMQIYGTWKYKPVVIYPQRTIEFIKELGVNAFEWDLEDPNSPEKVDPKRLKAMSAFTQIRHYADWEKPESTQGDYTYDAMYKGGWNYDAMYATLKASNIDVLLCLKEVPDWALNLFYPTTTKNAENVPAPASSDKLNPASYLLYAKLAFQAGARWGSNPNVPPALVSADTKPVGTWPGAYVRTKKVGENVISYMEFGNERDKWWKGRAAYQNGYEYAAMLSACKDGDQGRLGPGVGANAADPNIKIVVAGTAAATPEFFMAMIDWCRDHRTPNADGSVNLCFDIINYHWYAGAPQSGGAASCPELAGAEQVSQPIVALARRYNLETWITETGYDTQPGSPIYANPIGSKTSDEVRGDWIVRSALLYAGAGVNRCFFYQAYDNLPGNSTIFETSGLLDYKKPTGRNIAGDYLYQIKNLMPGYTYTKRTYYGKVVVYQFNKGNSTIYVPFKTTQAGETYKYQLPGKVDVYSLVAGSEEMSVQKGVNGLLDISEKPVFVKVN